MSRSTYGTLNQFNKGIVAPPWIITVVITINEVVVNIAWRASDTVLRIANANDIAPRKPKNSRIFLQSGEVTEIHVHRNFQLETYQRRITYAENLTVF